jgi:hypothetical protein
MKTSDDRAVIMNMLGDLVDRIDSYNAWIEVKGFTPRRSIRSSV